MGTLIKWVLSFFTGGIWGGVLSFIQKYWKAILVAIVLAGVYYYGHHSGYQQGYTAGVQSRDKEVQGLKDQITARDEQEAERKKLLNQRITELEDKSSKDAARIQQLEKSLAIKQNSVILKYVDRYPHIADTCGWAPPTVDAIRELLIQKGEL